MLYLQLGEGGRSTCEGEASVPTFGLGEAEPTEEGGLRVVESVTKSKYD